MMNTVPAKADQAQATTSKTQDASTLVGTNRVDEKLL